MIPKRIALKNFLTFGELDGGKPVEITFDDDEPLCVLGGANGIGKSAVFDAITYALYGEHRGSKQQGKEKDAQLIRHRANEFEIEFDFEFNGIDYRIRRTRPRKGRTTQHLQQKVNGEWKCVRGTDVAGAVKADDIENWVIETLGLGCEAFTNSVLLQQGKADKLFTASRDDRLAVLKGIIGFEQFESLSERIGNSAKEQADKTKYLLTRRDAIVAVTADDLETAKAAVNTTEVAAGIARDLLTRSNERVALARQWEKSEHERSELANKIAAADERAKHGRQIRDDKKTLDDFNVAVPVLGELLGLREQLVKLESDCLTAKTEAENKTRERDAAQQAARIAREKSQQHKTAADTFAARMKELEGEIKRCKSSLTEADAIAKLTTELDVFAKHLDQLLTYATQAERTSNELHQTATNERTRIDTLLSQAKQQRKQFSDVKVGVACPHCHQPVDESHAERVRAELAKTIQNLETELASANVALTEATKQRDAARTERERRQQQATERDKLQLTINARQEALKTHGITAAPSELRSQLATQEQQLRNTKAKHEEETQLQTNVAADVERFDNQCEALAQDAKTAEELLAKHERSRADAQGQERTTLARLSAEWQARLPNIDHEKVKEFDGERRRLIADRIAEKFKELEQDETRRAEWTERRAVVVAELNGIPEEGRIPEAEARTQHKLAEQEAKTTTEAHTEAVTYHKELTARKAERESLTLQHREAAERQRLLAKLDKLLGESGLQLELVRDAEEQIIAFANDTLQHLSDGDLSLEEDKSDDGSTKTFDLRARRGGGESIGVAFLSGSQRFRVAVSIALAVGRFACDRARRLESVIIDEGFGSLDPAGLQAMAAELKCLQEKSALRRIILVSHQPDFTEQFPSRYLLTAGPNGTLAKRVPR